MKRRSKYYGKNTDIDNIKQQSSCLNSYCEHALDSDDDGIPDC